MMRSIPITGAWVDRILDIENENVLSRLEPIRALEANRLGVHIARFGGALAVATSGIDWPLYRSVLGVEPDTVHQLDAIEDFYRAHRVRSLLEIAPGRLTAELGGALTRRGYAMIGFHAGLLRALDAADADADLDFAPGVHVEEVDPGDAAAFATWVDTYRAGWDADPTPREALLTWAANAAHWRFYLGRVDGAPAGASVLDVRGALALNASAATRAEFRGRGVQAAMIRRRIRDAARRGCEGLVGGAYFGTSSMRNAQRAGFCTAFTRGLWTPPEPAS